LLLAFIGGFADFAAAAASERDWGDVFIGGLFASPFAYALTRMVHRRRRFTISAKQR